MTSHPNVGDCPCQSGRAYSECCEPLHRNDAVAESAEALMRSRYSAFALGGLGEYLLDTWHDSASEKAQLDAATLSRRDVDWHGLEILDSHQQGDKARVEFRAHFSTPGHAHQPAERECLQERSRFIRESGRWFYLSGTIVPTSVAPAPSRNAPCPCGSGKKYKRCCAA
ncbi:YchJ family protein [Carnimonas bestiolae]|uniref:YchJ family protein n=1 Tax=Carnimonas bestiolae TaxID=3402172 RepID=UPI003EDC6B15